ncbi:hypothetical protein P7C70_g3574, partial [Phenoliferia sp. Uapishka_3]
MFRSSLIRTAGPALTASLRRQAMLPAARGFLTIVKQGTLAYRLTLGRDPIELQPGLSLFIPILHTIEHVDMRERALPLDQLGAFTSDNVPVRVSATLFYKVVDAKRACFSVQDYASSVQAIGTSALRSTIGKFSYDEIIADRNRLNAALVQSVDASVKAEGEYLTTRKQGEALAAQIAAIAHGLASATGETSKGPSEFLLSKAADIVVELRRQDMLRTIAEGGGSSTYFLTEKMSANGPERQIELDGQEKWKRSMSTTLASRSSTTTP